MNTMTKIPGVPGSDEAKPGMAFFVGTGPDNTTCGGCKHRGYTRESSRGHFNPASGETVYKSWRSQGCVVYKRLAGHHGPPVEKDWKSCRYWEPNKQ